MTLTKKIGKVRDAIEDLTKMIERRMAHVIAIADLDARIEHLGLTIASVLETPADQPAPAPMLPPDGQIPHERAIKLALIGGGLPASLVAVKIRVPEETVRRSLRLLAKAGRVIHNGQVRGRGSRWDLVGTVAKAAEIAGAQ